MGIGMTIAMAWRNLWRNRRRTLITLCGIVFGTFLAVLFTGMGDSMWGKMINLAARMGGGHVTIQHPEYLETPSLKRTVTGAAALAEQAKAHPRVKGVMVRVTGNALLAAGGNSTGAFFMAIDPSRETPETLSLLESIKEGELFKPGDKRGIVMGSKLAENLGLKLGRKVVYTMTDKKGEIVSGLGRLRGIIKTGSGGMDAAIDLENRNQVLSGQTDDCMEGVMAFFEKRSPRYKGRRWRESIPAGQAIDAPGCRQCES